MRPFTALLVGALMSFGVMALVIGRTESQREAATREQTSVEAGASAEPQTKGSRPVVIRAGPDGMLWVGGVINGIPALFLVDTGATVVSLFDAGLALRMNLIRGPNVKVATANGIVTASRVRLSHVKIAHVVLNDVEGALIPETEGDRPNVSLLGMSFLSRLKRWEYQNGKLLLEP